MRMPRSRPSARGPDKMIEPRLRAGLRLHARGARRAPLPNRPRAPAAGSRDCFEAIGEGAGVLDRLGRALREKGQHRMGGVAEQRDAPRREAGNGGPIVERPCAPFRRARRSTRAPRAPSRRRRARGWRGRRRRPRDRRPFSARQPLSITATRLTIAPSRRG